MAIDADPQQQEVASPHGVVVRSFLRWALQEAYFGIAEVLSPPREIDKWMRRGVTMLRMETMWQRGLPRVKETWGYCARGLEHKQKCTWTMAPEKNASTERGTACKTVSSNGAARVGISQGSMRSTKCQGTAGYMTRMSGGVGGGGREAFSYPDWARESQ